jgi:hypothetical protein
VWSVNPQVVSSCCRKKHRHQCMSNRESQPTHWVASSGGARTLLLVDIGQRRMDHLSWVKEVAMPETLKGEVPADVIGAAIMVGRNALSKKFL